MLKIKEYRLKLLLTQKQLAEKLNVASSTVGMWETGERKPDVITLKRLAEILECTTDDLLEPIEV